MPPSKRRSEEPQEMRKKQYPSPESPEPDRELRRVSSDPMGPPPVKRYVRFRPQVPPITNYKLAPEGWNPEDYDLQTDDIEANIIRCHERIEDGIMPDWWIHKLKIYEHEKRQTEATIRSMPAGLDWSVITRIKNLEHMQRFLESNEGGDEHNQLVNVKALITAYKNKTLYWDGEVTYLSNGKALARGDFSWDDVHKYNDLCNGKSFWVEGLGTPGPTMMKPYNVRRPYKRIHEPLQRSGLHILSFNVRVPGQAVTPVDNIAYDFLDDTGAEIPRIFYMDLYQLVNRASGRTAPFLCYQVMRTADDWVVEPTCMLEFNIPREDGEWTRPWVPLQVALGKGYTLRSTDRLSGVWMRSLFFVGSAPDNFNRLYVAETHNGIRTILPNVDAVNANPPPPIYRTVNQWDYLINWQPHDLLNPGPAGGPYLNVDIPAPTVEPLTPPPGDDDGPPSPPGPPGGGPPGNGGGSPGSSPLSSALSLSTPSFSSGGHTPASSSSGGHSPGLPPGPPPGFIDGLFLGPNQNIPVGWEGSSSGSSPAPPPSASSSSRSGSHHSSHHSGSTSFGSSSHHSGSSSGSASDSHIPSYIYPRPEDNGPMTDGMFMGPLPGSQDGASSSSRSSSSATGSSSGGHTPVPDPHHLQPPGHPQGTPSPPAQPPVDGDFLGPPPPHWPSPSISSNNGTSQAGENVPASPSPGPFQQPVNGVANGASGSSRAPSQISQGTVAVPWSAAGSPAGSGNSSSSSPAAPPLPPPPPPPSPHLSTPSGRSSAAPSSGGGSGRGSSSASYVTANEYPPSRSGSEQEMPIIKVVPPAQQSEAGSSSGSSSYGTAIGQPWSQPGTPWAGSTPRAPPSIGSPLGMPIGAPVFGSSNLASIPEEPLNAPSQTGGDGDVQMTTTPNASPPTGPTVLGGQPLKTPVLAPTSGAGDVGCDEEMLDAPSG